MYHLQIDINFLAVAWFLGKAVLCILSVAICLFIGAIGVTMTGATHRYERWLRACGYAVIALAFIIHLTLSHWLHM